MSSDAPAEEPKMVADAIDNVDSDKNQASDDTQDKPFNFRWGSHNFFSLEATYDYVDWDALLDIVKKLSGVPNCDYEGGLHMGGRAIIRRIKISGRDERWLAKLPQLFEHDPKERLSCWKGSTIEPIWSGEVATMKYLQNSDVPVPKLYGYDMNIETSPVKLPYILMECLNGNMWYDLGGDDIKLTAEEHERLHCSLAKMEVAMCNVPVDKIGSFVLKPDGEVGIGPLRYDHHLALTSSGPFDSVAEFFKNTINFKIAKLEEGLYDRLALSDEMKRFIYRVSTDSHKIDAALTLDLSNLRICHGNMNRSKILFRDNYEVVGLIDWAGTSVEPITGPFTMHNTQEVEMDTDQTYTIEQGEVIALGRHRRQLDRIEKAELRFKVPPKLSNNLSTATGQLALCLAVWPRMDLPSSAAKCHAVLDRLLDMYGSQTQ